MRAASTKPAAAIVLPGRGRVAEAVAADGARILADEALVGLLVVLVLGELVLVLGLLGLELGHVAVAVPVLLLLGLALVRRDQLGQHPGERVDLVLAQLGAGGRGGRLSGEHALEPEQEAEADLPARRGRLAAGLDLRERLVERRAAGGTGRQRFGRILAGVEEGLAGPVLRAGRVGRKLIGRVRRDCRVQYRF